jgi:hypothetical protein
MKKLFFIAFLTLGVVLTPLFSLAQGAESATVAATVTAQNISVTVSDGSITYGTLAANTTKSTISTDLNDTQTATNNGNVTATFNIRGQNSANWTLAGTAGVDTYVHQFCTATCGTPPTNFTALTTSNQTLASNVAASGTQTFELRINTPTSSSVTTQQSVDVTVQAVAP